MESWVEFIWTVAASSAGTAFLLGAAGFLARGQIAHWLARDLERIKASHQRDLEAYKVSLIAESERLKAAQDVKKTAALKFLEKKFGAIDRFHRAMVGIRAQVGSLATFDALVKTKAQWDELHPRMDELRDAENELDIFCTPAERSVIFGVRKSVVPLLKHCTPGSPSISIGELDKLLAETGPAYFAAEELIERMLHDMQIR